MPQAYPIIPDFATQGCGMWAIGYITPKDKLEGREAVIFAERKRKLEQARERRRTANRSNICAVLPQATALVCA
jgi:hypothetical protein